jgi:hypothetical protein
LTLGVIFCSLTSFSQNENEVDESGSGFVSNAFTDSVRIFLFQELNNQRHFSKLDSLILNSFLNTLAVDQAEYMAQNGENKSTRKSGKYKTIEERSKHFFGSALLDEATFKLPVKKGKTDFSEDFIAGETIKMLLKSKEYPLYLNNPIYNQIGISARLNEKKNNIFISVVFGSYKSLNEGKNYRKALRLPYSKKSKGLALPQNKSCLNCEKFKDYNSLYNGIKVIKGEIFLYYSDSKQLKKLLKKPGDGLAIDIVQKTQYTYPEGVITNYNLPSRGILLKPVRPDKIFYIKPFEQKAKTKLPKNPPVYFSLGKLPKKLKGEFELNLLVIQDNKVCKTLKRSYVEDEIEKTNLSNSLALYNEKNLGNKLGYKPENESTIISFIVPFEKNKFTFQEKDIQPILTALNEPDFNIDGVYIYSYSSIEGDSLSNNLLQKKRAESLKDAIIKIHKKEIPTFIKTQDSWDLFRIEVEDTKFEYLSSMKKKEAIAVINGKQLDEELEAILSKGRFARIVMDISYDLSNQKLGQFCSKKISSNLRKGKIDEALEILEFAKNKINEGEINSDFYNKLSVPFTKENISVINNNKVYKISIGNKPFTELDLESFEEVWNLDSSSCIVAYNYLSLLLKFNYFSVEQRKIKKLVKTISECNELSEDRKIQMKINFLFSQLKYIDTIPNNDTEKRECIAEIKSLITKSGENSIETNTATAKIFNSNGEFELAANLLEPYLRRGDLTENAVFTYITSCTQLEKKVNSRNFELAMEKASELNSIRFCELFGSPCLSFQLLENPYIKQLFSLKNCDPDHPVIKKEIEKLQED